MPGWWNGDDDNDGKSNREERQIEREENREEQRDREVERWKKQMERGGDNEKKKKNDRGGNGGGGGGSGNSRNIPGVPTPIEPPAQQQSEDYSVSASVKTSALLPTVPDFNKLVSSIQSGSNPTATFWAVVVLGWVLFGVAGFVMSLWCIGFTGNFGEKVIGVIIAMILGPWYWLYFYSVPTYCARLPPPSLF